MIGDDQTGENVDTNVVYLLLKNQDDPTVQSLGMGKRRGCVLSKFSVEFLLINKDCMTYRPLIDDPTGENVDTDVMYLLSQNKEDPTVQSPIIGNTTRLHAA